MPRKHPLRNIQGSAGAEFALVLPLLLILMFGGLEGAYYLWSEHKIIKAVRDGARFAGRQPFSKYDCTGSGTIDSATATAIGNVTRTGTIDGSGGYKLPNWSSNSSIAITLSPCSSGSPSTPKTGLYSTLPNGGPIVRVSATLTYVSLFRTLGFATNGLSLKASSQTAVMGI